MYVFKWHELALTCLKCPPSFQVITLIKENLMCGESITCTELMKFKYSVSDETGLYSNSCHSPLPRLPPFFFWKELGNNFFHSSLHRSFIPMQVYNHPEIYVFSDMYYKHTNLDQFCLSCVCKISVVLLMHIAP